MSDTDRNILTGYIFTVHFESIAITLCILPHKSGASSMLLLFKKLHSLHMIRNKNFKENVRGSIIQCST